MTLSNLMKPLNGDYINLYKPGYFLDFDKTKGWIFTNKRLTTKNYESFYKSISQQLCQEDMTKIHNPNKFIQQINKVYSEIKLKKLINKKKLTNRDIYFNSKTADYCFLSNFFITLVLYKKQVYPSAEHLYQQQKIKLLDSQYSIHFKQSALKAKQIGKNKEKMMNITKKAKFKNNKLKLMHKVIDAKFNSNPVIKQLLMNSYPFALFESTKDAFWGCGENNKGKNFLGKILEKKRKKILLFKTIKESNIEVRKKTVHLIISFITPKYITANNSC